MPAKDLQLSNVPTHFSQRQRQSTPELAVVCAATMLAALAAKLRLASSQMCPGHRINFQSFQFTIFLIHPSAQAGSKGAVPLHLTVTYTP